MATKKKEIKKVVDGLPEDTAFGGGVAVAEDEQASPELLELRAKVAQLEKEKTDREESDETSYIKEIEFLRRKSKTSLNEIKYKEIVPDTISLWHVSGHNVGKRVGPVMFEQGEETYLRFRLVGIKLSATKPTEEWIAKYKTTAEYKKAAAAETDRRSRKDGTRKGSEVDKLTKAIATMTGIAADKLNVLAPDESLVKKRDTSLLDSTPRV